MPFPTKHGGVRKKVNNIPGPPVQGGQYSNGRWTNRNGTQIGQALTEDSDFMPSKSTGDIPSTNLTPAIHIHLYGDHTLRPLNTQKAAKLANRRRGKAGY